MVLIGPVFFTLLQATLQNGFKAGWAVAWGIIASDIICLILCRLGVEVLLKDKANLLYFGAVTFLLLLGMGFYYLLNNHIHIKEVKLKKSDYATFFAKGFLVNFVNPFVFFVWTGISSYAVHNFDAWGGYLYQFGVLIGIFTTDTLKVLFANYLKPLLNIDKLKYVYKVIGLVLIASAFVVVYRLGHYLYPDEMHRLLSLGG